MQSVNSLSSTLVLFAAANDVDIRYFNQHSDRHTHTHTLTRTHTYTLADLAHTQTHANAERAHMLTSHFITGASYTCPFLSRPLSRSLSLFPFAVPLPVSVGERERVAIAEHMHRLQADHFRWSIVPLLLLLIAAFRWQLLSPPWPGRSGSSRRRSCPMPTTTAQRTSMPSTTALM